jgi:hypothetical protein
MSKHEIVSQQIRRTSLKGRKHMKAGNIALTTFLTIVLGAGAAMAQHDHSAMTDQPQGKPGSEEMMKGCQRHGSETMAALDKLDKTIAEGRETKDPTKMRAALDTAQKQLAEARHHMSMCPMMKDGGMEHMKGMSGVSEMK